MKSREYRDLALMVIILCIIISFFYYQKFKVSTNFSTYDEYYHVSQINYIKSTGHSYSILKDALIYPPDFILSYFDNYTLLMRMLPIVFGILNLIVIYLIITKIIQDPKQRLFTSLLVVISPVFIYIHTTYNMIAIGLFFLLAGSLLLIEDRFFLSLLSFLVVFLLNQKLFLIILAVLCIIYEKTKSKNIIFPLAGIIISSYVFIMISTASFIEPFSLYNLFTHYFSDFGADSGFGIFSFLLGLIGIVLSWERKKENSIMYYTLFALSICSLFDVTLVVFIDIILTYYAGIAFIKLWNSNWESSTLKNYVLLLIFCGLIFSSGSFINRFSKEGPLPSEVLSLEWLSDRGAGNKITLSYYDYGFLINAISGTASYTDHNYYLYSNDKVKITQSADIFASRDPKKITAFFTKNNITYLWINKKMTEGLVWEKDDDGMLLVLKNSAVFKQIYDYAGVQIWQFINEK